MKKMKIAWACAALAGSTAALAQSSVTLYGVIDTAVTRVSASGAGSRIGLSSGGNLPSRLGFRGAEDLGGGLKAGFTLEGSLGTDTGTGSANGGLAFQRRSTVSLIGPFGELRLGRDFTPTWWNISLFDPFNARGVGTSQAVNNFGYNTVYNSNAIGYVLPEGLGGIFGQLQYAFGEKASDTPNRRQGNSWSGRLGYASGPLNAAVSYATFRQVIGASDTAPVTIGRNLDIANAAVSWDFGVVKPLLYWGREQVKGAPAGANRLDSLLVGATAPLGNGELRATYARYDLHDSADDFRKLSLGYGYLLSKRTQVYATVARLNNKGAATQALSADGLAAVGQTRPEGSSSGVDLGIRHIF
ncbi:porin [Xylophilus sp.]|uniref:porin n=1 Tax=Xylophilus sp. TaxID=2653893 RepID=UPI0013B631B2|nr:porin [Xylophilus sp.]KAF1043770.1 MAG: Outer membrane porin protein 32 [Xylophilus sp.]